MRFPVIAVLALACLSPTPARAQAAPAIPSPGEGTVWAVDYIRTKPRKLQACLQFFGANWARNRAEAARQGLVLSYRVSTSDPSGPDDWDVMLLTEYRNLAALDGLEEKYRPILARRTRVEVPGLDVATDCVIIGSRTIRAVTYGQP